MAGIAEHNSRAIELVGAGPKASAIGTLKPDLEQVVKDHLDDITRLAYRLLGWQTDVEDIVQDVFLSAAQNMDTLRETTQIKAWLFQITINKCRTWRYRQKLRLQFWTRQRWNTETDLASSCPSEVQERDIQVRQAIRALPARYREVVVLKYLEQLPASEIIRMLKIRENALHVRLLRARAMLRKKLEKLECDL